MGSQKNLFGKSKVQYKNNKYLSHGIMFHHFHDNKMYPNSPGSLDKNQLRKIIKFIGKDNIIEPLEFIEKLKNDKLNSEICLTFDDALKCQFDIAQPILEEFKLKAFILFKHNFEKQKDYSETYRFLETISIKI